MGNRFSSSSSSSSSNAGSPRDSRCHLHRLATVEVQLVMHFLDATSRMRLARCAPRLLADASQAAAWAHCTPLSVSTVSIVPTRARHLSSSPLLRHVPVELRWDTSEHAPPLDRLPPTLRSIRVGCRDAFAEVRSYEFALLLDSPLVSQRLAELLFSHECVRFVRSGFLRGTTVLPALHTLSLHLMQESETVLELLAERVTPSLTDLTLSASMWQAPVDSLARVAWRSSLRRLYLRHMAALDDTWSGLLRAPALGQLEHLTLESCVLYTSRMRDGTEYGEMLGALLGSLAHLRSLSLLSMCAIDSLLAHVARLPNLHSLAIGCTGQDQQSIRMRSAWSPTAALLHELCAAAPCKLDVSVQLPPTLQQWMAPTERLRWPAGDKEHAKEQWKQIQNACDQNPRVRRVTALEGI